MYWCQLIGSVREYGRQVVESTRLNLNDEDYYTSQDAVTCNLQAYTQSSDRCVINQTTSTLDVLLQSFVAFALILYYLALIAVGLAGITTLVCITGTCIAVMLIIHKETKARRAVKNTEKNNLGEHFNHKAGIGNNSSDSEDPSAAKSNEEITYIELGM